MSNLIPYDDLSRMAIAIHKSGMFGLKTPEAAMGLFLIAQAEDMHPMKALRRYHVMSDGKVSMRTDAMLADYRTKAGGKVKWLTEASDAKIQTGLWAIDGYEKEISFTIEEARSAGYIKPGSNWVKDPASQLRARCISRAIRMMAPEVVAGLYAPEEMADFSPAPDASPAQEVQEVVPGLHAPILGGRVGAPPLPTAKAIQAPVDDRPLEEILGDGQTVAYAYLLSINWLTEGQNFCDLKPAHEKRIRGNAKGFLDTATAAFKKGTPVPETVPLDLAEAARKAVADVLGKV